MKKINFKKSSEQKNIADMGVTFDFKGVEVKGNKRLAVIVDFILNYAVALLLVFGALYTFITMFSVDVLPGVFPVSVALFTLLALLVLKLPAKISAFVHLGYLVLTVSGYFVFKTEIETGFSYIKDKMLIGISESMKWTVPSLSYTFTEAMRVETTAFMLFAAIVLVIAVAFFSAKKTNFFVIFILTFPFFEIGAAFGCVTNHFAFAVLVAGWTAVFSMYISVKVKRFRARKGEKKKKAMAPKGKQNFIAAVGLLMAIITFASFALGNFTITSMGYDRPEDIKTLRATIKETAADIIERLTNGDDGGLKEGKLYKLDEREVKETHQLTVEVPLRETVYLKGYVGEKYSGDRWTDLPETAETAALQNIYSQTGYYPQEQQGKLLEELVSKNTFVKESVATVTVSDISRKKDYAYLAYIPLISDKFTLSGDYSVTPNNKSKYSYTAYMSDNNFFFMNLADLYYTKDFSKSMQAYKEYVKKSYVASSTGFEKVAKIVKDLEDGKKYGYKNNAVSNLEIADRIRTYLADNIEFSLQADKLPANTDFLNFLLFKSKKGYSSHYATAMAAMLQLAGIPARYVEGYVITKEDFDNTKPGADGYYEINVTDKHAHAWIEIYETNYGWISIEATPGYYTGSLLDDSEIDSDEIVEEEPSTPDIIYEDPDSDDVYYIPPPVDVKEEEPTLSQKVGKILYAALKYLLILLLAFTVILLAVLLVLIIKRQYCKVVLKKGLNSSDKIKRLLTVYAYYNKLLKFEGIENTENLSYIKYSKFICSKNPMLSAEEHFEIMNIFLKYRFSNTDVSEEEVSYAAQAVKKYSELLLVNTKGLKKFKLKYIDNLI